MQNTSCKSIQGKNPVDFNLCDMLEGVKTMGITGHVRPDGDSVGSCMGLYLYIKKCFPQIEVDVYLDHPKPVFGYIAHIEDVKMEYDGPKQYDLFVTCDVSTIERFELGKEYFNTAKKTACIDHHISNNGFADMNHVVGEVSSVSEVLYELMDSEKIDVDIATALYTGIIHDTGVLQYSNTSPRTVQIVAELMKTGFNFSSIIEESFYQKTYVQSQIMGRVLAESILLWDGKCVAGFVRKREMDFYGLTGKDLDGIVSQLRLIEGVQVAIFMYETDTQHFKVSLRSNGKVDVSAVAVHFGGGGHVKASGCDMEGSVHDVINNITAQIELMTKGEL
ncbi:MAG: bifunctional oligoribonuclease/PAP phosphatase NrnA [Eubacteriales bacterium]|nr:bifunctional oligoribonuclease/PAP phosphatase NrnA [Eubacteriales bacterium]